MNIRRKRALRARAFGALPLRGAGRFAPRSALRASRLPLRGGGRCAPWPLRGGARTARRLRRQWKGGAPRRAAPRGFALRAGSLREGRLRRFWIWVTTPSRFDENVSVSVTEVGGNTRVSKFETSPHFPVDAFGRATYP